MEQTLEKPNAVEKLLQRKLVRRSFLDWCEFALQEKNETPALHHKLIIDVLQQVAEGKIKRVILLMPPGAAKSTYTSILFPVWYLNQHPQHLVLACSYSYTLIEGFGRQCRDLIERHEKTLGYGLSKTAAAAGDWRITAGGGYFCAGVNAGIAGHRADLGFIDDYLGTQIEADSQVTRDRNYEWYRNDFTPRLKPNAARIIIANRRHEDDLVGRLLSTEADKWTVIKLPMLAEENDPLGRAEGERLWPEWFSEEQVEEAKLEPRVWAGLYQQRPAPAEGNYFKKDWIVEYRPDDLPKDLRVYVGADYAVRKGQDSDRFCFLPAGVDSNGRLWILPDWFWKRADTLEAVNEMLAIGKRRKPICWWAGRENITGSIAPFMYKMMHEQNSYVPVEELSETKDKEAKAQSIKGRMAAKMVMFPSFAPGWADALHEMLTFPAGTHDDFVDALAKLGQGLAKMTPASVAPSEPDILRILQPPITCGWVQRSHRKEQLRQRMLANDN